MEYLSRLLSSDDTHMQDYVMLQKNETMHEKTMPT